MIELSTEQVVGFRLEREFLTARAPAGSVAGVWSHERRGRSARVLVEPFERLRGRAQRALVGEVDRLATFPGASPELELAT